MFRYRNTIFSIAFASILGSMSGVLKIVSIETPFYRLSVFEIPVIIAGFTLGPIYGGCVGFIADVFQMLAKGYPPSLMTISSMMWGIIPGFIFLFRKFFKNRIVLSIIMAFIVIVTSLSVFLVNTYQLYLWWGVGIYAQMPARLITAAIKLPIEIIISITIYYLYTKLLEERKYVLIE